ncbi:MAG: TetR/AcrR family transcriptional regulator [Proteobacteria bacterium]|nr:TetR/AcrR family transcriptional regulator [Pseudomonadota bacterium]MBI3495772.1 TetR/AcrR family transcriptional regulator [Pseudomonadota bacterium]
MHPRISPAAQPPLRPPPPPRERILKAARELVFRYGIRAVSVDEIAEAADSNKMTLYRHFSSKDALVAECLREFGKDVDAAWERNAKAHAGDPRGQLLTWLHHVAEFKLGKSERGCPLANAAIELRDTDHPARRVIEEFKTEQCARLVQLCRDTGLAEPERLADEIFLLLEGARISLQSVGRDGPGARFVGMVESLIADHARRTA